MKKNRFSEFIKSFSFEDLFNELGWNNFDNNLPIAINEDAFMLKGIVEKKGFVILHCPSLTNGKIPLSNIRKQIEAKVAKHYFEHLIIYTDQNQNHQIWQITIKEENKPKQVREISWYNHQDTEILFQRLKNLLFTLDEEEQITIVDVKQRISENFAKNTESVTKKFYTEFKKQHAFFLDFIQGIDDHIANKENTNKQWYASLMLNRLMFCYFIQKKGFLNQDVHYLGNKLNESKMYAGKDNFYSFYRSFLLELFHDGLGKPKEHRREHPIDLGKIPYLNGGLFDVHELEKQFIKINISDDAFNSLFLFFDQWNWHLDNSIEATGRDINPDVIGYIFEKYINDRAAMGAYYTKEDITDYIGKNTIIPFLFDETERNYKQGFNKESKLWECLQQSGDTYIYDAVKKGVPQNEDIFADLPEDIRAGFRPDFEKEIVTENTSPHLWEIRKAWNTKAPEEIALPTEIYREFIERRKRYAEIKSKIENGKINHINDFITYNLNIRQFTQDFVENTQDAAFIRHFYKAIKKITILDPTCGSGAFLFAAMNILEPLYEACIMRMEQFVNEEPKKHKFFEDVLLEVNAEQHTNLKYYIFKSIILNNLHGVDIMKEAVEIAKLRLFLKLVATVDVSPRKENYGLEPLPDIDFNIRAGNTLIGFATEDELLKTIENKEALFASLVLDELKEEFKLVSKAYKHFQNAQLINDQGSESFKTAKADLNNRLKNLNHKLNVYLATNYGIDATLKPEKFQEWLTSHQPFHWFAEFYQIVAGNGGFDCIIGNPPYVRYGTSFADKNYKLLNYSTLPCNNLHALIVERCFSFLSTRSYCGYIVPLPSINTSAMEPLQRIIKPSSINKKAVWISAYDERPSSLFEGVDQRLIIEIIKANNTEPKLFTSKINRWYQDCRNQIFVNLKYSINNDKVKSLSSSILKLSDASVESNILPKYYMNQPISLLINDKVNHRVYYRTAGGRYWKTFLDVTFGTGAVSEKSTGFTFSNYAAIAIFSSDYFWWHYSCHFDMFNLKDYMIFGFRISNLADSILNQLDLLGKDYVKSVQNNAELKTISSKTQGSVEQKQYIIRKSKFIIDQIDTILAQHYGFTEEELDFIINYDIKYRMGKSLFGEENLEEEEE